MPKTDDKPQMIDKVSLAIFKDRKLLMAREHKNQEVFYTIGGKRDGSETDVECLQREVKEELNCGLESSSLIFLEQFEAPAYGKENTILRMRVYKGELVGSPHPTSEIAELAYFDNSVERKHLTPIDKKIFPWLKKHGYIN